MTIRIGTAGWALPRDVRESFPEGASNLHRYAGRFNCAEINTSFYRPHKPAIYARWAASVPDDFRFSVKLPKAISHEARLVDCAALLERFAEEVAGLGSTLGPILVQLPPKLAFDAAVADRFFVEARRWFRSIVCEPRHASWFEAEADALLTRHDVGRVAADPARVPDAARPGGSTDLAYFRLHGSPRPYWSSYEPERLAAYAEQVRGAGGEAWVIFDNTTSGAAARNALALQALL